VLQSRSPLTITPASLAASLGVFLVVGLCMRLGFWQLDRRADRLAVIEVATARTAAAEIADPELLRDSAAITFRRARFSGDWDHDRSIVLPARSYQGAPGVHLLTPLRLRGSGLALLVNRGWVPAPDGATIDFDYFRRPTSADVEGVLLPFPSRADSRGRAQPAPLPAAQTTEFRRTWFAIDESALRAQFPYTLAAVQLQVTRDDSPGEAPLAAAPPALDEGPHLGYAIQWFSFALIAFFGWIALVARASQPARRPMDP
jgi:surfeit locus 1 family protein